MVHEVSLLLEACSAMLDVERGNAEKLEKNVFA